MFAVVTGASAGIGEAFAQVHVADLTAPGRESTRFPFASQEVSTFTRARGPSKVHLDLSERCGGDEAPSAFHARG